MTGGGGSSYSPGERSSPAVDCSTLEFETVVASPAPNVVAAVAIREVCEVVLVGTPPGQAIELWVRASGEVLGSITDRWADLRECLQQGARFAADVLTVEAPVRVRVRPRSPCSTRELTPRALVTVTDPSRTLAPGERFTLAADSPRVGIPLAVKDADGNTVGTIAAEPICLPELLAAGHSISAVVDTVDPLVVSIVVT